MTFFLSFVFVLQAWAVEPTIVELLEVYRDMPDAHDQAFILLRDGEEVLSINSNLFVPGKIEFGTYSRSGEPVQPLLKDLRNSLRGGEKPAESSRAFGGWHVSLLGEELDPFDPRFDKAFQLLIQLAADQKWDDKSVIKVKAEAQRLVTTLSAKGRSITRKTYSRRKVCNNKANDLDVCVIDKEGFIYLPKLP